MRRELIRGRVGIAGASELDELCHFETLIAARIDATEGLEVEVHVEREPVIARAAAHADAYACQLSARDIHPGSVAARFGRDPEVRREIDHAALESGYQVAYAESRPPQVDQWVHHELPWAVVGYLAAAVDVHDWNIARRQHVSRARVHAKREHRRMLEKPDFIGRGAIAFVREALHGAPRGLVISAAQAADHSGRHFGSGALRAGCARALRYANYRRSTGSRLGGCRGSAAHLLSAWRRASLSRDAGLRLSRPALLRLRACSAR